VDDSFGLLQRGWRHDSGILDDPDDTTESILTVVLSVGEDLNPSWTVEKQSSGESKLLSDRNRALFGMGRIGTQTDRHLAWAQGSSLTRITEKKSEVKQAIVQMMRQAKTQLDKTGIPELDSVAAAVRKEATIFGVLPASVYRASLDSGYSLESGAIALHQGDIPLRMFGTGTRKLVTMAIEQVTFEKDSILLVDELEHGLEPHRIRELLRILKRDQTNGQVIFTTHSPSSILESEPSSIYVVRSDHGKTVLHNCSENVVNVIRSCAPALLARRLIVCEGKTELGICRGLNEKWHKEFGYGASHLGVEFVNGQGITRVPNVALALQEMGYDVAIFVDADTTLPRADELKLKGIPMLRWESGHNTEGQACKDLSWTELKRYVELGESFYVDRISLFTSIQGFFDTPVEVKATDIDDYKAADIDEDAIRAAVAKCSTKREWFKDISPGFKLGCLMYDHAKVATKSHLSLTVGQIKAQIYGNNT
jgi:hypothetical protein